jgi:hypothetical protein
MEVFLSDRVWDVKRKYGQQRRVDPRKVLLIVGGRMHDDRTWMCEIGFDLPFVVRMLDQAVVTMYFEGGEVRKMAEGREITFRDLFASDGARNIELSCGGKRVDLDKRIDSQL